MAQALDNKSINHIPLLETDFLNPIVKRYQTNDNFPAELLNESPYADIAESIKSQKNFNLEYRNQLADLIISQYADSQITLEPDSLVLKNIEKLRKSNTVTATTGQQIHIFLGPFFVVNKLLSCCAQAKRIETELNNIDCVPIFWMATEDHDFEEINSVNLYNEVYTWDIESHGPVGRIPPQSLLPLVEQAKKRIDQTPKNLEFIEICEFAYKNCRTFADASRYIIHQLFKSTGIVVIDPDNAYLKQQFSDTIKSDLFEHSVSKHIDEAIDTMKTFGIKAPINTRPINLFYIEDSRRTRIERINEIEFQLLDDNTKLNSEDIKDLLKESPEVFSPNALLRPLFQQTILPNVDYVCGMSEFVYWLEVGSAINYHGSTMPKLSLRKSAFFTNKKNIDYLIQNNIPISYIFLDEETFVLLSSQKLNEKSLLLQESFDRLKTDINILTTEFESNPSLHSQRAVKYRTQLIEEVEKLLIEHSELSLSENKTLTKIQKFKSKIWSQNYVQERNVSIIQMVNEMLFCINNSIHNNSIFVDNTLITLAEN